MFFQNADNSAHFPRVINVHNPENNIKYTITVKADKSAEITIIKPNEKQSFGISSSNQLNSIFSFMHEDISNPDYKFLSKFYNAAQGSINFKILDELDALSKNFSTRLAIDYRYRLFEYIAANAELMDDESLIKHLQVLNALTPENQMDYQEFDLDIMYESLGLSKISIDDISDIRASLKEYNQQKNYYVLLCEHSLLEAGIHIKNAKQAKESVEYWIEVARKALIGAALLFGIGGIASLVAYFITGMILFIPLMMFAMMISVISAKLYQNYTSSISDYQIQALESSLEKANLKVNQDISKNSAYLTDPIKEQCDSVCEQFKALSPTVKHSSTV